MGNDLLAARALHFVGIIMWVGGLFAVGRLLVIRDGEPDAAGKSRLGQIARQIAMIPDIGALFAILGGGYILLKLDGLLALRYMQLKIVAVVLLIALHGFIRVKAKKASQGQGTFPAPILGVLGLVTVGAIFVVVFKPLT